MATLGERLAALSDASPLGDEQRSARMIATIEDILSTAARERGVKTLTMTAVELRAAGITLSQLVVTKLSMQHVYVQSAYTKEPAVVFEWPVAPECGPETKPTRSRAKSNDDDDDDDEVA